MAKVYYKRMKATCFCFLLMYAAHAMSSIFILACVKSPHVLESFFFSWKKSEVLHPTCTCYIHLCPSTHVYSILTRCFFEGGTSSNPCLHYYVLECCEHRQWCLKMLFSIDSVNMRFFRHCMGGTFLAPARLNDSDIFQKAIRMVLRCIWVWFLIFQDSDFNLVPPIALS